MESSWKSGPAARVSSRCAHRDCRGQSSGSQLGAARLQHPPVHSSVILTGMEEQTGEMREHAGMLPLALCHCVFSPATRAKALPG